MQDRHLPGWLDISRVSAAEVVVVQWWHDVVLCRAYCV